MNQVRTEGDRYCRKNRELHPMYRGLKVKTSGRQQIEIRSGGSNVEEKIYEVKKAYESATPKSGVCNSQKIFLQTDFDDEVFDEGENRFDELGGHHENYGFSPFSKPRPLPGTFSVVKNIQDYPQRELRRRSELKKYRKNYESFGDYDFESVSFKRKIQESDDEIEEDRDMEFEKISELQRERKRVHNLNQRMRVLYDEGIKFRNSGMFNKAIECFSKIIRHAPDNITGYNSRGYTNLCRKKYSDALIDFDCCVRIDSNNVVVLLNKAKTHIHLEQYRQALLDYENIIRVIPGDSRGYNGKGVCLRKLGFNQEAMKLFTYSVKLGTHPNEPLINRAIVNSLEGNHGDAIEDLNKLIDMNEGNYTNQTYLKHLRGRNLEMLKGQSFTRNVPRNRWGF